MKRKKAIASGSASREKGGMEERRGLTQRGGRYGSARGSAGIQSSTIPKRKNVTRVAEGTFREEEGKPASVGSARRVKLDKKRKGWGIRES